MRAGKYSNSPRRIKRRRQPDVKRRATPLRLELLEERTMLALASSVLTGAGPGGGPHVKATTVLDLSHPADFFAYAAEFAGGVRVAGIDVDADGTPDILTGAGPGGGPHVKVFSGDDRSEIRSFQAYDADFTGGVFVASGDLDGDGTPDILTGMGELESEVRVFSGTDGALLTSFIAYPENAGGVTVASGDVDGDGRDDIITGAGPGGVPQIKAFSGVDGSLIANFFAYDPAFDGGLFVAAGDYNGDGRDDIITGAGAGGGPHVKVFDINEVELASFFAYESGFSGGVTVAAANVDGDPFLDLITGAGPGGGPHVKVFSGADNSELASFYAYDQSFAGGVFVGWATESEQPPAIENIALTTDPGVQQMPSVAVNPLDPNHVVVAYMDYSLPTEDIHLPGEGYAGIGVAVSLDGGQTWQRNSVPLPTGFDQGAANPIARFDAQGVLFVSFMAATFLGEETPGLTNPAFSPDRIPGFTSNNGIFVVRSDTGGFSWSAPIAVVSHLYDGETEVVFDVNPDIAIDVFPTLPNDQPNPHFGNLYMTWSRVYAPGLFPNSSNSTGGVEIRFALSRDGGASWETQDEEELTKIKLDGSPIGAFDQGIATIGEGFVDGRNRSSTQPDSGSDGRRHGVPR